MSNHRNDSHFIELIIVWHQRSLSPHHGFRLARRLTATAGKKLITLYRAWSPSKVAGGGGATSGNRLTIVCASRK